MNFLEHTASELYTRHKDQLHRLAVVFPNRRQSVFFKNHFAKIVSAPAFMPQLFTIEELVQLSSSMFVADPLVQSFELYKAYSKISLEDGEESIPGYEQFYPIGETLLKDFREMDAYLVNVEQACQVLYNIEGIEKSFEQLTEEQKEFLKRFWSSVTNRGYAQQRFLKLWKRLPAVYKQFHLQLQEMGFTTLGMAYRQLAADESTNPYFALDWDHVAFVGFNAFNRSEEALLQRWQQKSFASFWFDADLYYLRNKNQEAGFFLRKNFERGFVNEAPSLDVIGKITHPVSVTAVQGHTAQAKMISAWLTQLNRSKPRTNAIILADESLLLPVLQSIPASAGPVNVTMGHPVQHTVLFSFFTVYFNVLAGLAASRYTSLHYLQVQEWLSHPLCDWKQDVKEKLMDKMISKGMLRVSVKLLQKQSAVTDLLITPMLSAADIFSRLRQILQLLQKGAENANDDLLQGALTACWQAVQASEPVFASFHAAPSLAFISQVLRRQLSGITIPFEGEPLQGIQVMGLLESRGLDFDNILLLGAAEGSLPRVNAPQTFLPDAVRRAFDLPVPEYQDAIFAYTFYRLLHRSKTMQLVYNALVTDNSTGEPSRFIQQLAFETSIPFKYSQPGTTLKPTVTGEITIQKTPEIQRLLGKYLAGEKPASFSPSQVNSYLSCRLQYFFKYLAQLKKPDELTEEVDPAMFGSIVHKLMEKLYISVKERQGDGIITTQSVEWMREQVEAKIIPAFQEVLQPQQEAAAMDFTGILQVIKEVAIQYANGFLELDHAYAPFSIVDLEVKFLEPFPVTIGGSTRNVFLNGVIDRVDEKNGLYRMVDYKTGADKPEFHNVERLFEREGKKQNKAALQTLIYSWMFQKRFPERAYFEPALVPLRALAKEGKVDTRLAMKESKSQVTGQNIGSILLEIQQHLKTLLEEIFNPDVPYDQTTELKTCAYCDYAGICNRK